MLQLTGSQKGIDRTRSSSIGTIDRGRITRDDSQISPYLRRRSNCEEKGMELHRTAISDAPPESHGEIE
eukprot:CAMPEP_0198122482 /NCGR_PEP_ID=MMETSP1442-20131203/34954_1 /TAXON_ID= /ORGANISM="Craspedostauros australis, Strain CCMP3328" /LENGTH=68 /DNA_ID=CAMNT_0043781503 /DNA_START=461 /DNA_END=667 /DNA_ORIENTATION=+